MQNKKYGEYGGQYVAESLMNVLKELESAYNEAINEFHHTAFRQMVVSDR